MRMIWSRKASASARDSSRSLDDAPQMTFAELFEWWWKEYGSRLRGDNEPFARKRLLPALGAWPSSR